MSCNCIKLKREMGGGELGGVLIPHKLFVRIALFSLSLSLSLSLQSGSFKVSVFTKQNGFHGS